MQKRMFIGAVLSLFVLSVSLVAQSDRGTITGSVTDPSEAAVAGAKVEVRNLDNGNTFNATSTAAGDFTISSVPSGKYSVIVSAPGFKTANESGVQVLLDQTVKVNVVLQIGQTSETISVTAEAEVLKTDNAEQSMNVSGEKVSDLPLSVGGVGGASGAIRNPLAFIYLAPGVSGTAYTSEVNGLPGGNFKVYLEGQDSTSNTDASWTSSVAQASTEAITEFAVQSSNFSAEFGQVMGGLFNFTTKSGTNQYHGSAYEYWANEFLDAAHPYSHVTDKDRKNDYGFSIGGPVRIPKVYNGKNHTFFFFNLERFANDQAAVSQTGTVPTAAYRAGDFSSALAATSTNGTGPAVQLTDPTSGYTYLENQIFDPLTTYTDSNGRVVRNPFPNNVIPQSRLDPVALKIQALIPAPVGGQNTLNWVPDIVTNMQQDIPSVKIDQDFGAKTKASFFWTYQGTNQVAAADGLPEPLSSARPKVVGGYQVRFNLDRTISPTMVAHLGLGFYRFHNPDSAPPASLNYPVETALGLVGSSTGLGFPAISGLSYNNEGGEGNGFGPTTADHQTTDLATSTGSLSWVRGRHTYKAGLEIKQDVYSDENLQGAEGVYTFSGGPTAIPFLGTATIGTGAVTGSIGSGYASFLLGDVTSTTVNPARDTQLRRITEAVYIEDNWKVTPKLTLDYGLRWDRTPLGAELWNRESEIGLNTPNPNAGNLPGGFIFAGSGPGRCNCQFSKTYNLAIGPRLGLAYQINKKTVFRAGWGVSYSAGDSWAYLNGGTSLNGLGINSVAASATSFGLVSSQLQNGIVYSPATLYAATLGAGVNTTPGQLNTFSAVWGGLYDDPGAGRPARINQWNIALQRQVTKDMSIEAAYVGNRGVWEQSNGLVALNEISPAMLAADGLNLTNAATRTLLTSQIGSAAAKAAGYTVPYVGFPTTATVAQALRPFPEYQSSLPAEFVAQGDSFYDSLQVKLIKRMGHGLDVSSSYTFQRTETIGQNIDADPTNRSIQKELDPSDQPNVWVTAFTYRSPKFTSDRRIRLITGNWTLGGILRYASGALIAAPQSQTSKYDTYTFAPNNGYMERVPGVPLYLTNINCGCIDPNNINQRVLNPAAWTDAAPGTIGDSSIYYNDYRGPHQFSENMNFGRTFQLREKMTLNIRAEFFNVFNRIYLGAPSASNPTTTTTVNSATGAITGFGYYAIGNTSNFAGQRNGQLVARFVF